jgi:hypothetical protein
MVSEVGISRKIAIDLLVRHSLLAKDISEWPTKNIEDDFSLPNTPENGLSR